MMLKRSMYVLFSTWRPVCPLFGVHINFLFRRLITCKHCEYSLIGERQKGHVYYRCHTTACPTKGVREENLDQAIRRELERVALNRDEQEYALQCLEKMGVRWKEEMERANASVELSKKQLAARLERLTDALIGGIIDQGTFAKRKEGLVMEEKGIAEREEVLRQGSEQIVEKMEQFLELVSSPVFLYELGTNDEKRVLIGIVTSNRTVDKKTIDVSLTLPFSIIAEREKNIIGGPDGS